MTVAVAFALGPQTAPNRPPGEIALVSLETLGANRVVHRRVQELIGLDRLADAERRARGWTTLAPPRTHPQGMPVFVVRADERVRAFLGVDPRTGCALDNKSARLSEIRDGVVYAAVRKVVAGGVAAR